MFSGIAVDDLTSGHSGIVLDNAAQIEARIADWIGEREMVVPMKGSANEKGDAGTMKFNSKLTPAYEDYLIRLIFGSKVETNPLSVCVDTAYLDFNRTLRGISKVKNRAKLHTDAVDVLTNSLSELKDALKTAPDQNAFDEWHEDTCTKLISVYEGSHTVYAGQAQKWVNMTLKYVYTLGEERISGFQGAYPYCHAPLDNIVIGELARFGFPALTCVWSQVDYHEYFERQKWIRSRFTLVPLDVEFLLWLGKPIEVEYLRKAGV